MSITRINQFTAAENKANELWQFLSELRNYIVSSDGCLDCEVLRKINTEHDFLVIEHWTSTEAHAASVEHYPHEKMQAAMALIGAPPSGDYYQQ